MSNPNFKRGARPTPSHILQAARPFESVAAAPEQFAIVPKQLSVWGNDRFGDCVTAEEAYAKAVYSMMAGLPQLFITEAEVINWARTHRVLNGASLTGVMKAMQTDGLNGPPEDFDYKDGNYHGVDYSDESVLRSAIAEGPVKLGIAANGLPGSAGDYQGWFDTSGDRHSNEDHCVALSGYGRADFLYEKLQVSLPNGLKPSEQGYLLFTWGTIGFVSHSWLMGSCQEAWLRTPTTVGQTPAPPVPPVVEYPKISGAIFATETVDGVIAIRGTLTLEQGSGFQYVIAPAGDGTYRVEPRLPL
jgi:hypothetical protein